MIFLGFCKYQDQLAPMCWAGIFLDFFFLLLFAFQYCVCAQQTRHSVCMGTRGGWHCLHGKVGQPPSTTPTPHPVSTWPEFCPQPPRGTTSHFSCCCARGVPPRASVGQTVWDDGQELITRLLSSPSLRPAELGKEGGKAEAAYPLFQLHSTAWQLQLEGCSQNR